MIQPNTYEKRLNHLPQIIRSQAGKWKNLNLNLTVHFPLYPMLCIHSFNICTRTYVYTYTCICTYTYRYKNIHIDIDVCVYVHIFLDISIKVQIYKDRQSSIFWTLTLNNKPSLLFFIHAVIIGIFCLKPFNFFSS